MIRINSRRPLGGLPRLARLAGRVTLGLWLDEHGRQLRTYLQHGAQPTPGFARVRTSPTDATRACAVRRDVPTRADVLARVLTRMRGDPWMRRSAALEENTLSSWRWEALRRAHLLLAEEIDVLVDSGDPAALTVAEGLASGHALEPLVDAFWHEARGERYTPTDAEALTPDELRDVSLVALLGMDDPPVEALRELFGHALPGLAGRDLLRSDYTPTRRGRAWVRARRSAVPHPGSGPMSVTTSPGTLLLRMAWPLLGGGTEADLAQASKAGLLLLGQARVQKRGKAKSGGERARRAPAPAPAPPPAPALAHPDLPDGWYYSEKLRNSVAVSDGSKTLAIAQVRDHNDRPTGVWNLTALPEGARVPVLVGAFDAPAKAWEDLLDRIAPVNVADAAFVGAVARKLQGLKRTVGAKYVRQSYKGSGGRSAHRGFNINVDGSMVRLTVEPGGWRLGGIFRDERPDGATGPYPSTGRWGRTPESSFRRISDAVALWAGRG